MCADDAASYHSPACRDLWHIYQAALNAVDGETLVRKALATEQHPQVAVIAVGKAAPAMMRGASAVLQERMVQGLMIAKQGDASAACFAHPRVERILAGHPVPNQQSLEAGGRLLRFVSSQPPERALLFLISGGASSLVEVLPAGMSLDDLQRLNHWLLGSGLDIVQMNRVRKAVSRIKGGGLLPLVKDRRCRVLLISDVPGDDLASIGSGMLYPDAEVDLPALPSWVKKRIERTEAVVLQPPPHQILGNLSRALAAAWDQAGSMGYPVYRHQEFLSGEVSDCARRIGGYLRNAPYGIHLWGGETQVRLPPCPGRGGRNQHLALALAVEIQGREELTVLAAGTDGTDGPTQDAGACVDGLSMERMTQLGLDAQEQLARADAGSALAAVGELLHTGPTGTNVMDLLICRVGSE